MNDWFIYFYGFYFHSLTNYHLNYSSKTTKGASEYDLLQQEPTL